MGCAMFMRGPSTRYQEAREVRGLSLAELSKKVDIPVEQLRAFEVLDGGALPTGAELARLSDVLDLPTAFFFQEPRRDWVTGWIHGDGVVPCGFPGCVLVSDYLCDWPVGKGKTCDLPLCERHRVAQGGETRPFDLCPQHALAAHGQINVPTVQLPLL